MKAIEMTTQKSLNDIVEDFWSKDGFLPDFSKIDPTINIADKNGVYKINVSAPGYKKKKFHIAVEDGALIISAETKTEKEKNKENYVRKEFSASSFSRRFRLPDSVNIGHIKAKYNEGLLKITINKAKLDHKEVKEIKIN